jgi:tetratricopeptide (TPR) repeat protein
MYNLLVANTSKEWNGDPFILEIDRCVNVREYTDKKIAEKYGNLSLAQIDEIIQFSCIFAYETQCHKDPKFGFIREITKRQGKVKILYEIIQLDKFLTHSDLEEMHFELDIHLWEYSRTHWSIKDVDLPKELVAKEIYLLQSSNTYSKVSDTPRHHFDASFPIPREIRKDIEPIIAAPENEIGRDRTAVKIFFCYAREDEALLNKLKAHLKPLQRQSLIDIWYDRDISAGTEWEQEIDRHLNAAQIILLLVSPDFMNSDYCYSIEMKRAVERHERKEARVIPVILDHVYWQVDLLNKLQALPTDAKPVMSASWHSLNEALFNVTEGIRKVVEQLTVQRAPDLPIVAEEAQPIFDLKGYKEELTAFEQAIQLDPTSVYAHNNKGATFFDLKHYEEALTAYEQAIQLDPAFVDAHNGKGAALFELKRYEEALTAYEQAIQLNPTSVYAHNGKGAALSKLREGIKKVP